MLWEPPFAHIHRRSLQWGVQWHVREKARKYKERQGACKECRLTFALQVLHIFWAVAVTDELLLHAEASDVGDFLNVGQVLILVVHRTADGALPSHKQRGWLAWQCCNMHGNYTNWLFCATPPPAQTASMNGVSWGGRQKKSRNGDCSLNFWTAVRLHFSRTSRVVFF